MSTLDLEVDVQEDVLLARARGEVDAANAESLARAVEVRVGAARTVVLDLTDLDYLDSAGIHMLFQLGRRLDERGRGLRLVVPEGCVVHDALRYADALTAFDVRRTVSEAAAGG